MLVSDVKKLKPWDVIHWIDPDDGSCSRDLVVRYTEVIGSIVCVEDVDGSVLKCHVDELRSGLSPEDSDEE